MGREVSGSLRSVDQDSNDRRVQRCQTDSHLAQQDVRWQLPLPKEVRRSTSADPATGHHLFQYATFNLVSQQGEVLRSQIPDCVCSRRPISELPSLDSQNYNQCKHLLIPTDSASEEEGRQANTLTRNRRDPDPLYKDKRQTSQTEATKTNGVSGNSLKWEREANSRKDKKRRTRGRKANIILEVELKTKGHW